MNIKLAGIADWKSIKEALYDGTDMSPDEEGERYHQLVREHFAAREFAEDDFDAYTSGVEAGEDAEKKDRDRDFFKALFG